MSATVRIDYMDPKQFPDSDLCNKKVPENLYGTSRSRKLVAEFNIRSKSGEIVPGPWEISKDEYDEWLELVDDHLISSYLVFGITPDIVRKVADTKDAASGKRIWNAYTIACIIRIMRLRNFNIEDDLTGVATAIRISVKSHREKLNKNTSVSDEISPAKKADKVIRSYSSFREHFKHLNDPSSTKAWIPVAEYFSYARSPYASEWGEVIFGLYGKISHLSEEVMQKVYNIYLPLYEDAAKFSSTFAADIAASRGDITTLEMMKAAQMEYGAEFFPEDADNIPNMLNDSSIPRDWVLSTYGNTDEVKQTKWDDIRHKYE